MNVISDRVSIINIYFEFFVDDAVTYNSYQLYVGPSDPRLPTHLSMFIEGVSYNYGFPNFTSVVDKNHFKVLLIFKKKKNVW